MPSIVAPILLASDGGALSSGNELWLYPATGVALFVLGCVLTILANARRAAAAREARPQVVRDTPDPRRSASVNRLQHDVRGWLKRTS